MAFSMVSDALAGLRARAEGVGALTEREVLALKREAVGVRRDIDVVLALISADLDRRSQAGASGMARRAGFRSVDQLIASETGGTVAEAERLRTMGHLIAGSSGGAGGSAGSGAGDDARGRLGDDAGPGRGAVSPLPLLAAAASAGRLSPDACALLREALMLHPEARERVGLVVDDSVRTTPLGRRPLEEVEKAAIAKAEGQALRTVRSLVHALTADLTASVTAEERYEELHERRFARFREERDGMVSLSALLDPMTAAPLKAAVEGYVKKAFRTRRDQESQDARTGDQLRADGLGWLGRHATGCDATHDGIKTTVSIRMSLADLRSGEGYGDVDGIAVRVPVGVLRRHAADAQVVPTVFGMGSEVLDHGRAKRLFTAAQRRAIAERDRGCAWCGAPPSHCDVHHIVPWERGGETNVRDGIMLCVGCHHWIHHDGWAIRMRRGSPEFIPPRSVDPERRPRPGFRALTTVSDRDVGGVSGGGRGGGLGDGRGGGDERAGPSG